GAVVLTFLAVAELDPDIVRKKVTEVSVVGLVRFLASFLGCAALAYYALGWDANASWLCGVALSTTSMVVVILWEVGHFVVSGLCADYASGRMSVARPPAGRCQRALLDFPCFLATL